MSGDEIVGVGAQQTRDVRDCDTAIAVGSGEVDVLATPIALAWLEGVTVAALADRLPEGCTTVGHRVEIEHLAPSRVGESVTVRAEVLEHEGRRVAFAVAAESASGRPLARGRIERVIVDLARFAR